MKALLHNQCHCLHVDELQEQMAEREEEIIHIANGFRGTTVRVDERIISIEADLGSDDPWSRGRNKRDRPSAERPNKSPQPPDEESLSCF